MKFALAFFLFLAIGCVQNAKVEIRTPAQVSSAVDEAIDLKFEKFWDDNPQTEASSLRELGKIISTYVESQAAYHRAWRVELQKLNEFRGTLPIVLQKRKQSLEIVVHDLPNSEGLATRDVHRRTHSCLAATFSVDQKIPSELQKGLFVPGTQYDAVVRFSNGNPRNLPDIAPDARGMAVKLLPTGTLQLDPKLEAKSLGENSSATYVNRTTLLDLLAINFPVFFINDPVKYAKINSDFLAISSTPEAAGDPSSIYHKYKEALSVYFDGINKWETELALDVNGSIILNPLHEEYWSMMSYRLGALNDRQRTAIKYKWTPCGGNLPSGGSPAWTKSHDYAKLTAQLKSFAGLPIPKEVGDRFSSEENRYYLRRRLITDLTSENPVPAAEKKCFLLQVQNYIDELNTPVEDTTQVWLESEQQRLPWVQKYMLHGGPGGLKNVMARGNVIANRKISPLTTIGQLTIEPVSEQTFRDTIMHGVSPNTSFCEHLSFDPWNNVPSAHKPLGIVGRMRKSAYSASKNTRHYINKFGDRD